MGISLATVKRLHTLVRQLQWELENYERFPVDDDEADLLVAVLNSAVQTLGLVRATHEDWWVQATKSIEEQDEEEEEESRKP
jgi:hypothetical protein